MIVRKHLGLESADDQLPSTSRGRGGGTPVPLLRVSCSPSDSESSARSETVSPSTPREDARTAKSVRMNVIHEDGPPSSPVAKIQVKDEDVEMKEVEPEPQTAPPDTAAPMTFAELHSYDPVFSAMRERQPGAERDPSTIGFDIAFIRQMRQGMFDDSTTVVGSDEGSVKEQGVKAEAASGSQEASLSTRDDAPILPNQLMPKPEKRCPFTDRPPVLISRRERESRDARSSEVARDVPGVVAAAMTEHDSTPPSL